VAPGRAFHEWTTASLRPSKCRVTTGVGLGLSGKLSSRILGLSMTRICRDCQTRNEGGAPTGTGLKCEAGTVGALFFGELRVDAGEPASRVEGRLGSASSMRALQAGKSAHRA
jgi:hypothetical protein